MRKKLIFLLSFIIISCDDDSSTTSSCTDESACNTGTEGNCTYAEENYDCNGNCIDENECISPINGCTDSDACNYDINATNDDNTCLYQYCIDPCSDEFPDGSIFIHESGNNQLELWYDVPNPVLGFQFDIYGITIEEEDIIVGDAEDVGLNITYYNFPNEDEQFVRILGYRNDLQSQNDIYIPNGCGTLLGISSENNITSISNIVFGGVNGGSIEMNHFYSP